jgi:hypothetical protein
MSMTHLNQDRLKAMLPILDDWKICTSVLEDNLMKLTYNMLPSFLFQVFTKADTLHDSKV